MGTVTRWQPTNPLSLRARLLLSSHPLGRALRRATSKTCAARPHPPPFPQGLIYAHIFCSQFPALADGLDTLQTAEHGDGAGLGFGRISFPSAQTGDDPCGLGYRAWTMRVLLLFRLSLQGRQYSLQDLNLFRVEHVGGSGGAVRQGQLHGARRSLDGQTGQLRQAFPRFDLAGFNIQPLLLQGPEQWSAVAGVSALHCRQRYPATPWLQQHSTRSVPVHSCPSRKRGV